MKIRRKLGEWLAWGKRQTFHFVFISSLLALTLLVTWWALFLYQSVEQTYQTKLESIRQSVYSYSLFLSHNPANRPVEGPYKRDFRLEVVHSHTSPGPHARSPAPFWSGLWLKPQQSVLDQLENKYKRRRFMIVGESGFLVLLILVSGLMIYRMYWLEKRTTQELHDLWSRVSHEIKTPITGVKAFLETLQAQPMSREEMEPLLELALKQVERQQQLSENMLIGQKIKRRGAGIKMTRLDLPDFIQSYVDKHPHHLSGRHIRFDRGPEDNQTPVPDVSADAEALRIIFDNLVDNAVKYGGADVSIVFKLEQVKRHIQVTVEDNGPGFQPEMAESIFKAYRRVAGELPGKQRGTGMGLYICRRLARKMGGQLTAQSEGKGKGARFILSLTRMNRMGRMNRMKK
jgi:signal transduction histidine kinase